MLRIRLLFSLISVLCTTLAYSQVNQYLTREDSDPHALSLLDKLDVQLKKDRLSVDFEITITHPAEEAISQRGQLIQQGHMYHIITADVEIWCNGELRWIYTKDVDEVNLYSADEDEVLGPLNLISQYTGDDYVAILSGSDQIRSLPVQVIEMKPVQRDSEIAKIRLFIQQDGKPVRIEIMEKTAARTVADFIKIGTPEKQPVTYFTFNKADFPGVHVEDLRID